MSAAMFVGRVGGLAVALGVSAAALSGTGTAWADSTSSGSDASQVSASSDSSHAPGSATSPRAKTATDSASSASAAPGVAVGAPDTSVGTRVPATRLAQAAEQPTTASNSRTRTDPADSTRTSPGGALPDDDASPRPPGRSRIRAVDERAATPVRDVDPAPLERTNAASRTSAERPQPQRSSVPDDLARPLDVAATPVGGGDPILPTDSALNLALLALANRRESAPAALAAAAQNTGLIMGPSGMPLPTPDYLAAVMQLYINPNSPPGTVEQPVFTPEGLYPITGVKSLPLNTSVEQGLTILLDTIKNQVEAGNTMTIFGYSQSAIISSLAMSVLDPTTPVSFILTGNEMNPDGGMLSRFPGVKLPSLGLDFYGATPADAFPTMNYTLEFDGFADFPRYPLNFLSVLNAGLGIVFVHPTYAKLTLDQVTPVSQGGQAIELQTSSPTQRYFIIPTENLPLLQLVRALPLIGNPLADLWQPALRVIVNMGYGDPAYGWSTGTNANEQVTFGLLPPVDWGAVAVAFVDGIFQGFNDFLGDFSAGGSVSLELAAMAAAVPSTAAFMGAAAADPITTAQSLIMDVATRISGTAAAITQVVNPTLDIINAFVTILPAYDTDLFLAGISQAINGDPINGLVNAAGLPIAANVGLGTTAVLVEVLVLLEALEGVLG